jgi:hypothetical protein
MRSATRPEISSPTTSYYFLFINQSVSFVKNNEIKNKKTIKYRFLADKFLNSVLFKFRNTNW